MIRMKDFLGKSSQATSRNLVWLASSRGHGNTIVEEEQSEWAAYGILAIRKDEN
jgi:hypothetical protein